METSNDHATKKYIEIAQKLLQDIEKGVYREGDRIPPIRKLSELYGANPQTVNKATAYLASLGYLKPRQGVGSVVCVPSDGRKAVRGIAMLIDRHRSRLLSDLDDVANYHGKDIYLTYLMEMSRREVPSSFIIYDRPAAELSPEFLEQIDEVAGFIVQGSLPEVYLRELATRNIPTVFINRQLPAIEGGRFGSVLISLDQVPGIMNYLLSLGHTRILYLLSQEFEENGVFAERYELARRTAEAWRLPGKAELRVFRFMPGDPDSVSRLEQLVGEGFHAALGYNDASALSFYTLLHQLGLSIPGDFSVAGFDDITVSRLATPPLSTVRVDRRRMVHQALELLDRLSRQISPARVQEYLPTDLVLRSSAYICTT